MKAALRESAVALGHLKAHRVATTLQGERLLIVDLIFDTQARTGLSVQTVSDPNTYPLGIKVTNAQMTTVHIERENFHSEWNYIIRPCNQHA